MEAATEPSLLHLSVSDDAFSVSAAQRYDIKYGTFQSHIIIESVYDWDLSSTIHTDYVPGIDQPQR